MTLPLQSVSRRVLPLATTAGKGLLQTGAKVAQVLPDRATALPRAALGGAVKAVGLVPYDKLATRGVETISRLRGVPTPAEKAQQAGEAVEAVLDPFTLPEPVAELVEEAVPGATLSHDELPLVDYDHLTLGSLRARIRRLDAPALIQLRDYERAHANRLPVIMAFENRLKTLAEQAPGAEQATLVDA